MIASVRARTALRVGAALVLVGWLAFAVHALFGVGEGSLWDARRRCAGSQCDADVVRAFEFVVRTQPALTETSSPA